MKQMTGRGKFFLGGAKLRKFGMDDHRLYFYDPHFGGPPPPPPPYGDFYPPPPMGPPPTMPPLPPGAFAMSNQPGMPREKSSIFRTDNIT